MNELLAKLKEELEKLSEKSKIDEAQTVAIKELTDYVNLLIDETAAVDKTNEAQDEIDALLFQQVYELIQKTDELAKNGVKLSKVQNLEIKLDREVQAIKEALKKENEGDVKDYSELKDKIADLKEKDIKTDDSIKRVKNDLTNAKTESAKINQAQNKEIAENEEDIVVLKKEQKEIKRLVDTLYSEFMNFKARKSERESATGVFKTFCIKFLKELIRFSLYFAVITLINSL
jgi:predicted  nucleic acid-binding Zn-ribbon protein